MTLLLVLIITSVTAIACALIGNFLVLTRSSMLGDAISHGVLPAIVVAFLLAETLESPLFFVLSVIFAVAMAIGIQWISERVPVGGESVTGIIFTMLFALGVVMLVLYADNVHLDQDAVLYGQLEFSPWNRLVVFGYDLGPRALWTMGVVGILNLLVIVLFYKELLVSSFDRGFAKSAGFSPRVVQYLVMLLSSITVVAAFEAVGAVLVVALLIVPAATAYLMSRRLAAMIAWSVVWAVLASVLGFLFALSINGSVAGSVAMMSGVLLVCVVLVQLFLRKRHTRSLAHREHGSS